MNVVLQPARAAPLLAEASLPKVLVLARTRAALSNEVPWQIVHDPMAPFEAIIAVDERGSEIAEAVIRQAGAWREPVVDLSGRGLWFADFTANEASAETLRACAATVGPICSRLAGLATATSHAPDTTDLLARLYSRQKALEPAYAATLPQMLRFPLAGLIDEAAEIADHLVDEGCLQAAFFDRLHVCPGCGSSRLNVREECTACRSADIREVPLLHHFRCAHQDTEDKFRAKDSLLCPKCGHRLRQFGGDYDRPGSVTVCRTCRHIDGEPQVGFRCMDCGDSSDGTLVKTRDWHRYVLTPLGERRLLRGDAGRRAQAVLGDADRVRVLIEHWLRVGTRYGRPLTALQIAYARLPEAERQAGPRAVALATRHVADIVRGELRETDILLEMSTGLLLVLPETDVLVAEIPRRRLEARIAATLALDLGVRFTRLTPEDALLQLERP